MQPPDDSTFRLLDWFISAIGGLLLILWGMLGLRIKKVEDSAERLESKHQKLEVEVAKEYAPRDDVKELGKAIFDRFDRIENLIHSKADK